MIFTRLLFLLLLLLLSGCMPKSETALTPTLTPKSTKTLSSWEAKGLLGIRQDKKAWSAQFIWTQQGPNQYHLRLFGPFGGGTILIDKVGNQVIYQDDKKKVSATKASTLLRQQTGIQLPVESLYYWVRGLPAPGPISSTVENTSHERMQLSQFGYHIQYGNYQTVGTYRLPGSLKLEGPHLLVKLVIKQWHIR